MEKIRLETEQGEFVVDVKIPRFKSRPAVILWGSRVFIHVRATIYRECFAVAATEQA